MDEFDLAGIQHGSRLNAYVILYRQVEWFAVYPHSEWVNGDHFVILGYLSARHADHGARAARRCGTYRVIVERYPAALQERVSG